MGDDRKGIRAQQHDARVISIVGIDLYLQRTPARRPIVEFSSIARVGGPGVPIVRNKFQDTPLAFQFGSYHPQICNFAFADGSVRAISNTIDTITLGRLCNRADSEIINYDGFQ